MRREQTLTESTEQTLSDHESPVLPVPSSNFIHRLVPSRFPSPGTPVDAVGPEGSPLTKYQCYHRRITYSGAAFGRCTLGGFWRTRGLLQTWRLLSGMPARRAGRRRGVGDRCWWRLSGSRKAGSNDVCLALEEGPLAGLEDTGFGTKMMAEGCKRTGEARSNRLRSSSLSSSLPKSASSTALSVDSFCRSCKLKLPCVRVPRIWSSLGVKLHKLDFLLRSQKYNFLPTSPPYSPLSALSASCELAQSPLAFGRRDGWIVTLRVLWRICR